MLIQSKNIYEILNIDRDADVKTIKKAYAKLVKQYHPEDNPEEWKRIHDAYEQAMQLASGKKQKVDMPSESPEQELTSLVNFSEQGETPSTPIETSEPKAQPRSLSEEQQNELDNIFGDVEKVVHEQQEKKEKSDQEKIARELQTIKQLARKRRLRLVNEWEDFFSRRNLLPIISQREFLLGMGECLKYKTIDDNVYIYLSEQLERITDYLKKNSANLREPESSMDAVRYVRDKLKSGNNKFGKIRRIAIMILFILFLLEAFLRPLMG